MDKQIINLGRVAYNPKGTWDETTNYKKLDTVFYIDTTFYAKKDNIGNTPEENSEYWGIMVKGGNVTNAADEEDLHSVEEAGTQVLKLSDRVYSPEKFSGKGYKILRKNIKQVSIAVTTISITSVPTTDGDISFTINGVKTPVTMEVATDSTTDLVAQKVATELQDSMTEYDVSIDASLITLTRKSDGSVTPSVFSASTTGVVCTITDSTKREFRNILTQAMINKPNTIYVIQYDFTLGEDIIIPANCVLKFDGGSISGDNIKKIYLGNNIKVSNGKFTNILIWCTSISNISVENCIFENTSNEEIHIFHIDSVNDLNIFKCKFNFDRRTITCIYIRRSSNINILNNTFACTPFDISQDVTYITSAISFDGNCEYVEILENDISYFGIGISFTSDLSNNIKNIKIINNLIHHCTVYGINLYENGYIIDGAIVKGNSIHDISGTFLNSAIGNQKAMGAGIYLLNTDNVICSNNNIYNVALQTTNEESLAPAGIGINGSNHISCIGNIIHHTGKQGIINGGNNNIIDGNIIYNTGTYGIDFRFGENVVISNNTIHDVTNYGIFVRTKTIYPTKNSSIIIEGNSINTSYFGILAINIDAILQITNNKIYNFTLRGLHIENYNNATISENVINSSQPNSIALYVVENSVVSISNNTLKGISSSISVEPTAIVKENSNTLVSENWSSDSLITHKVLTVPSESPYIANNTIFNNNFNMYTINGTGTIAGLKNVPPRSLIGLYINSTNLILKDNATDVPYRFRLMSGDETITSTSFILFYANNDGHLYVVYKGTAS